MPRIKLSPPPGPQQAKAHPREYALLTQAKPAADGQVELEALQRVAGEYGSKGAGALPDASDNVPFDQLASALSRPATHPDAEGSGDCLGLAARDSSGVLSPLRFARRALGPDGVRIQIAFCGICHSDLHQIRNEWGQSKYPMVPAKHDLGPYLSLLTTDGRLVLVGLPEEPLQVNAFSLAGGRKLVAGSSIGGIKETQEMLDFCGEHGITCQIEHISADYANQAMERLAKNDVKYRFVIDVQGSLVA